MGFTAPIYESPRAKEKPPYQQFPGGSAQTLRSEMTRLRNSPSMQAMSIDSAGSEREKQSGWLDWIERVGNRLPHPMSLFIIGAVAVLVLSQIADWGNWSAEKTVLQEDPGGTTAKVVVEVTARGLLMGDGAFWTIDSLVKNFTGFAPLGVVLVGMLGIGVAERSGAIGALLKVGMLITPARLLTPAMIFIGILSSMGLDAGYVVLPPIAAALYKSVGRSPLVGLAAAFVGVSAGFSANLFITGLDPMLAELSSEGAQILDSGRNVAATANLWFMITSTIVLTLVGWGVTAWIVEPRYSSSVLTGGSSTLTEEDLRARTITPDACLTKNFTVYSRTTSRTTFTSARYTPASWEITATMTRLGTSPSRRERIGLLCNTRRSQGLQAKSTMTISAALPRSIWRSFVTISRSRYGWQNIFRYSRRIPGATTTT